ncbi:hypothetical protein PHJA_002987500, partial [Phtheirospermum japonicum]
MQIQVKCSCGEDGCLEWAIVELQGAVEAHELRSSKAGLEFPVDSFVSDVKGGYSREPDIEMGSRVPNSDLGLESFNKQIQDVEKQVDKLVGLLVKLKNLANRQKPSCGKGTAVDRSRMNMTKCDEINGKVQPFFRMNPQMQFSFQDHTMIHVREEELDSLLELK